MPYPLKPIHPRGQGYYQPDIRGFVGSSESRFERGLGRYLSLRVVVTSDHATLDTALVQIGEYGELVVDRDITLDATEYTIGAGIRLIPRGGKLIMQSGTTLTVVHPLVSETERDEMIDNTAGGTLNVTFLAGGFATLFSLEFD